jgi:hypothetical protein
MANTVLRYPIPVDGLSPGCRPGDLAQEAAAAAGNR